MAGLSVGLRSRASRSALVTDDASTSSPSSTEPTPTPPTRAPNMSPMAVVCEIAAFDRVELIEPVDDAPAGARGGVLELGDGDTAMVEITTPALDPVARIVFRTPHEAPARP